MKQQQQSLRAPPPEYNVVQAHEEENGPSYFDIVGRLKKAKAESRSSCGYLVNSIRILYGSCILTILLTIYCIWDLAMIYIGLTYRYDCIVQDKIPTWLVISGIIGIVLYLLRLIQNALDLNSYRYGREQAALGIFDCLIYILLAFNFIWFLIGNIWVYGVFDYVRYEKLWYPAYYCDWLCYRFAFWSIIVRWIIYAFMVCLSAICVCTVGVESFILEP